LIVDASLTAIVGTLDKDSYPLLQCAFAVDDSSDDGCSARNVRENLDAFNY